MCGLLLWIIPGEYNIIESGFANVDGLFYLAPWLFLFLCPAVTMRIIAEEKQSGTWELLLSKPLRKTDIVLGKFFASWLLVFFALLPSLLYFFFVWYLAEPLGNVDSGAFWGSFIGLLFLSQVYLSVGIFASAVSPNQIVSFILAMLISFTLYYGFEVLSGFILSADIASSVTNFGIFAHYRSMSRGVLDSRDILYFMFISVLFLWFTILRIKK